MTEGTRPILLYAFMRGTATTSPSCFYSVTTLSNGRMSYEVERIWKVAVVGCNILSWQLPAGIKESNKTSVSTSGVPGEIRMRYFPRTSRKRYCPSRSARSDKQGRPAATNTFDVDTIFLTIKTTLRQPRRYIPGGGEQRG
jgi:hypothetical protein